MPALLLGPDDYRTMPWANGRGSTLEYIAETHDGGLLWRVSKARVVEDGPFSRLPGIDRTIMLVSGPGFCLDFEGEASMDVRQRFDPVSFSGDWQASASGVAAPCQDLNVMTRRGLATASVTVHRSSAQTILADRSFFIAWEGHWSLGTSTGRKDAAPGQSLFIRDEAGGRADIRGTGLLIEVAIRIVL